MASPEGSTTTTGHIVSSSQGKCAAKPLDWASDSIHVVYVFPPILAILILCVCVLYYYRISRSEKARRILEQRALGMPPPEVPEVPNTPENLAICQSLSVVICSIQSSPTEEDETRESAQRGCNMCEMQRMVGAAICSKCGNGLFLVARHVNLEEEDRNYHRMVREQSFLPDESAFDLNYSLPRVHESFQRRRWLSASRRGLEGRVSPDLRRQTRDRRPDAPASATIDGRHASGDDGSGGSSSSLGSSPGDTGANQANSSPSASDVGADTGSYSQGGGAQVEAEGGMEVAPRVAWVLGEGLGGLPGDEAAAAPSDDEGEAVEAVTEAEVTHAMVDPAERARARAREEQRARARDLSPTTLSPLHMPARLCL